MEDADHTSDYHHCGNLQKLHFSYANEFVLAHAELLALARGCSQLEDLKIGSMSGSFEARETTDIVIEHVASLLPNLCKLNGIKAVSTIKDSREGLQDTTKRKSKIKDNSRLYRIESVFILAF